MVTTFNVKITPPQLNDNGAPQTKTGRHAAAQKVVPNENIALNQLAVVVVDLAGNVVRTIPLDSSNSTQNPDGSWSIRVPGIPQLDCIVVANLNGPITVFDAGDNVFDSNLLFTPTTDEDLEVSLASTAAYQNFVDSLGGEGTFDDLDLDVNDPTQLAALNNLIETIQDVLDGQTYINAASIAGALAAVKDQVQAIVQVEVDNIKAPAANTSLAAATEAGDIAWFESFEPSEIYYGVLSKTEDEKEYVHNGEQLVPVADDNDGDWILQNGVWIATQDTFRIGVSNEDGSVTFNESTDQEGTAIGLINGKATQAINLAGRNIADFFNAYGDTRGMVTSLNPSSTFPEGAVVYRTNLTSTSDEIRLWYNPGNEAGECPWDANKNANDYGGNCETLNTWTWDADQPFPVFSITQDTLAEIQSPDVDGNAAGAVLIPIDWSSGGETITVQLVNNAAKEAHYYRYNFNTGELELLTSATWSDLTLPGITGDAAAAIAIDIPEEVMAEGNFESEDRHTLFAVNEGSVRIGHQVTAGTVFETGVLLYNATASESVLDALNYQPAIAGAWVIGGDYLMFSKDGSFVQVKISNDDENCQTGFAAGSYSWNPTTLAFSLELDQDSTAVNSDDTCSAQGVEEIAITGDTMTMTEGDETFEATKINASASAPLAGAWAGNYDFFVFTGDNTFIHAKVEENGSNCQTGWASGTFTYDELYNDLVATVTHDYTDDFEGNTCTLEGNVSALLTGNTLLVTLEGENSSSYFHRFGNPLN